MEYVFVGGKPPSGGKVDYTPPSINQSKNLLISLIEILSNCAGKNIPRINSFYKGLECLNNNCNDFTSFIDSGGYSIIVGDVKGEDVSSFIYWYCESMKKGFECYDYIFSLDIPVFLNEPKYNTKESIEAFNRQSLTALLEVSKEIPEIWDKLYFIWQFKIKEQYDIWNKLYNELELNKVVKNRALGGMVGLRGVTQINFSPFIGPMYRCLLDYIENGDFSYPFQLHNLGIYIQHDRFMLCFLEKLFNRYLEREDTHITYDSVNYMRTAQLRSKELPIYTFRSGQKIEIIPHLNVTDDILREVYYKDHTFNGIKAEIQNVLDNKNLNNIDAFTPLNVYSNVQLDKFFSAIIDRYNLVDAFYNNSGLRGPLHAMQSAHSNVFTSKRMQCIKENFLKAWEFHNWFMNQRTYDSLEPIMNKFIADIKFPAKLENFKPEEDIPSQNAFNTIVSQLGG